MMGHSLILKASSYAGSPPNFASTSRKKSAARCIRDSLPDERMLMVAVTGRGLAQDRAHTRAAGFDHHFTKPVALGELFGRLVSWRDELNASARE